MIKNFPLKKNKIIDTPIIKAEDNTMITKEIKLLNIFSIEFSQEKTNFWESTSLRAFELAIKTQGFGLFENSKALFKLFISEYAKGDFYRMVKESPIDVIERGK